jgi:hypothetical protein
MENLDLSVARGVKPIDLVSVAFSNAIRNPNP